MDTIRENLFNGLVFDKDLNKCKAIRRRCFILQSVPMNELSNYKKSGWEEHKLYKTKAQVKKEKPFDIAFEDEIWSLFADMGFNYLNKDRQFKIPYSENYKLTQQIDVFVLDDETILIIECKASSILNRNRSFKEEIDAIGGKKAGLFQVLHEIFPDNKYKVKIILATKNYVLSSADMDRLKNYDIAYLGEEEFEYYRGLTNHLGSAAKYQLLGSLFRGKTIPELNHKVPAIRGKLGGHQFYSFSIEPERLLKMSYVLHRTKANKDMMPTYQRIIKKDRLKKIKYFINSGGYFPNSVLISIDSAKELVFERANTQCNDSICTVGVLSLPKVYGSSFIIDGQHRVYGYSDTHYESSNTIPVVAFVNLNRSEQVNLFMQINENQKSVSKNLRNTLNADLLWGSNDLNEALKAFLLRIAQELGENRSSPLYKKVIIGENSKTNFCCITIDTIYSALNRGNFVGKVAKNTIKVRGSFYDGDLDSSFDRLFRFITLCLDYFRENLFDEWEIGDNNTGFLSINPTIYSLIRIFSDIIDHLEKTEKINTYTTNVDILFNESKKFLDPIIHYFRNISFDEKSDLRKSYGTGGLTKYWRSLQMIIRETHNSFDPDGLDKYIRDSSQKYNTRSFEIIRAIELFLKKDIINSLKTIHGDISWWKKGVPFDVYTDAENLASKKNRDIEDPEKEVKPWDQLHLIDYRKIILQNWRALFENKYSYPDVKGNKEEKTKWLHKFN
ncbi:MAG: DGQHR domain-containing protein [Ignavibacteriales bacterium]|nr:DGQHR domain-containing protein [Ignavibacteriales bacterium]